MPPRKLSRRTFAAGLALLAPPLRAEEPMIVETAGAALEVDFAASDFDLPPDAIRAWVARSANAVSHWLGSFPVSRAVIQIVRSDRNRGVGHGVSRGGRVARSRVSIGQHATVEDLDRDWVMTHEMFHFALPDLPELNSWMEEGLSTWAEPVARAAVGQLTPEQVWNDVVRDLPQGLPRAGDRGLDLTHTWGRTYWGGALFCLLADIGIRKATAYRAGLGDAVRAVNRAGGNINVEWPLTRALETGDRATGTHVLSDLYRQMATSPFPVDLPGLWKQLGVIRAGGQIAFDDHAPLAEIRRGITGHAGPL